MRGRQSKRRRYVVHFSDGGAGTRYVDRQLDVGDELRGGGQRYEVERVEQPTTPYVPGHAWLGTTMTRRLVKALPRGKRRRSVSRHARDVLPHRHERGARPGRGRRDLPLGAARNARLLSYAAGSGLEAAVGTCEIHAR
jgi:hypothetical protein